MRKNERIERVAEGVFSMKKLTALLAMFVFALGLLAAGCGGGEKKTAEGKDPVLTKDELIVGTEPSFAPFEFPKKNSEELTGFDIELIQALAKDMGYKKTTIKSMGFDALIPAVNNGNLDVGMSGFTITEERKKQVLFTDSYYKAGLGLVVRKEVNDVKSVDDLKGKTVAVQLGTTGALYAEKLKDKGVTVKTFNTSDLACLELKTKGADAVISDKPVLQYFLAQGGSDYAKMVGTGLTTEDYGIVVSKKHPQLQAALNKSLANMKKNGEYDKLYEKWFGEKAAK